MFRLAVQVGAEAEDELASLPAVGVESEAVERAVRVGHGSVTEPSICVEGSGSVELLGEGERVEKRTEFRLGALELLVSRHLVDLESHLLDVRDDELVEIAVGVLLRSGACDAKG